MNSLEEIIWRNASYEGVVEFRVTVPTKSRAGRDTGRAEIEDIAKQIKDGLAAHYSSVRVEHVRYPG